jgi:hypothetical protein
MVLLALPPADHLLIERDRGQFVPSRRRRMMANVRAEGLLKIPVEPSPELRPPALQLKREWSPCPEFSSDPRHPRELSKGLFATTFRSSSPLTPARQKTELLVELVNAGLATATIDRMVVGGRRVKVIRMRITAAGRRALAKLRWP